MNSAPVPAVSVIVPMFNRPEFIGAALASVRRQSMADFEAICVDAGSSEPVPELVASLIVDDPRFRLIVSDTRLTGPEARNVALEQARAPVVASLDSDDVMVPGRLALHLATLAAEPRVVALGGGLSVVNRDGLTIKRTAEPSEGDAPSASQAEYRGAADSPARFSWMLPFNCPTLSSTMTMRTEALRAVGGFDTRYHDCDDYGTFWALQGVGDARVLPEVAALYRHHPQQLSTAGRRRQSIHVLLIRREIMSARLGRPVAAMAVAGATGHNVAKPGAYDDGEAICHELFERFVSGRDLSAADREWIEADLTHRLSVVSRARTRQAVPATTPQPSR